MDITPLPLRASLEQYEKQAKDLIKAYGSGDTEVMRRALRAPHESERLTVCAHEREIGLEVTAVDCEYERRAHASASF